MSNFMYFFFFLIFQISFFAHGRSEKSKPIFIDFSQPKDQTNNSFEFKKPIDFFMSTYLKIYQESPSCFLPYAGSKIKKEKHLFKSLVKDICSGSMKGFCDIERDELEESLKRFLKPIYFNSYVTAAKCFVSKQKERLFLLLRKGVLGLQDDYFGKILEILEKPNLSQELFRIKAKEAYLKTKKKSSLFFDKNLINSFFNQGNQFFYGLP